MSTIYTSSKTGVKSQLYVLRSFDNLLVSFIVELVTSEGISEVEFFYGLVSYDFGR